MKKLLAALVLVVLPLGLVLFLRSGGGARGEVDTAAPVSGKETPGTSPRTNGEALAAPEQVLPQAAEETRVAEAVLAPTDAAGLGDREDFDTTGARWVDVEVILPTGVPIDDEVALLAFSGEPGEEFDRWQVRRLTREVDLTDAFVAEAEDDEVHWARREVRGGGRLRMPFHPDSEEGLLLLVSRYVYAPSEVIDLEQQEGPLVVEGVLGAWVTGRVLLPDGAAERGVDTDEFELEFEGRGEEGIMGGMEDSRQPRLDDELAFELRAISAENKYFVRVEAPGLVDYFELSFRATAGEHVVYDIPLELGVQVSGLVIDEAAKPVSGVRVEARAKGGGMLRMMGGGEEDTLSKEDGTFTLSGIPGEGTITLSANSEGYLEAENVEVEAGANGMVTGAELVLRRGNRIAGRVLWPDGSPAAGAEVSALLREERGWRSSAGKTQVEDDGSFVLTGLEDGPFEVRAQRVPQGTELPENYGGLEDIPLLSRMAKKSDAARRWQAFAKAVPANRTDLVLTLEEPLGFPGRVVDDTGAPVTEFEIAARVAGTAFWSSEVDESFESEDGSFLLAGVYAGDWIVEAEAEGYAPTAEEGVPITIPHAGEPVVITLARRVTVQGIVVDPQGIPVPDAEVVASAGGGSGRFGRGDNQDTETDAEGRFTLEDCAPSGLGLTATSDNWAPSESVPVVANPGETVADVMITLRVGGTITGEVFDGNGEPAVGKTVSASAGTNFNPMGGENSTQTDGAGRFRIEHVAPGKVTVVASPREEELFESLASAEAEEDVAMNVLGQMQMESVEVADGEEVHVVLGARPKEPVRVTGTVSEDGQPLPEAAILVIEEGGAILQGMKMARSDEHGAFEVTLDRPGDFVFNVSADGFGDRQVPFFVEVPESSEHHVDLELPLGTVAGRIEAPDGSPLGGIGVRLAQAGGIIGALDFDQSRNVVSADDGSFRFEHVDPGTYSIHAGGSAGFFAEGSLHYGARVLEGIQVKQDARNDGIVVRLSRAGKVTGVVRDAAGAPVVDAAVFVRNQAGNVLSAMTNCMTDGTGQFTYNGVPDERVTAFARKGSTTSTETAPFDVPTDGEASIDLVLNEGTFVIVELLNDGEPVRARVEVLDEEGRQVNGLMSMAEMESFFMEGFSSKSRRVGPVPPGTYQLRAVAPDGSDAKKTVQIRAGQSERKVKLRLR